MLHSTLALSHLIGGSQHRWGIRLSYNEASTGANHPQLRNEPSWTILVPHLLLGQRHVASGSTKHHLANAASIASRTTMPQRGRSGDHRTLGGRSEWPARRDGTGGWIGMDRSVTQA